MKEPERFVGIDISKEEMVVAVRPTAELQNFPNTEEGLAALVGFLQPLGAHSIVLEATGGFARAAVNTMALAALPVVVVNPRQRRQATSGSIRAVSRCSAWRPCPESAGHGSWPSSHGWWMPCPTASE